MAAARLTLRRDGATVPVEISSDGRRVTIAGTEYPVRVVADRGVRVEVEIAGAVATVGGWPTACAVPPGPVEVNGESWSIELERESGAPAPASSAPTERAPAPAAAAPAGTVVVLPPMPGRIVEVRVREGETVREGAVLLVLEAMKMRNEVVAPVAGVVRELRVRDGANVRAREPMLRLEPG